MLIQCTKKLLNKLKINTKDLPESVDENPLYSWHANLLTINRRNVVVLVNDSNRYIIVLYGLLAKDFKQLDKIIPKAIQEAFREEQIDERIIDKYLQHAARFTFTKTKNRTSVARMNISIDPIYSFLDLLVENEIIQTALSARISRFLITHGELGYIEPHKQLVQDRNNF